MSEIKLIEALYQTAFPADERRDFDDLAKLAETQNEMCVKIDYIDGKLLGFIIYWEFNDFIYVEHFAVYEQFRGKKHGTEIFRNFLQNAGKLVILEVEPPDKDNALAEKRILFYERLGMILNNFPYVQPPYNCNKNPVKMLIMSNKNINEKEFAKTKNVIFEKVYFNSKKI